MKIYKLLAVAAAVLALAACNKNSAQQMADASSKVGVSCEPAVLTAINNVIPVSITVDYPAGYFAPESKLAVTPSSCMREERLPAPSSTIRAPVCGRIIRKFPPTAVPW